MKPIYYLKRAWNVLLDLVFPDVEVCIYCGSEGAHPRYRVCKDCASEERENMLSSMELQGRRCYPYMRYCDISRKIVHNLKYNDQVWLAEKMGERIFNVLRRNQVKFDTVTFVPLHKSKQRMRGYNQSERLARHMAKYYGIEPEELLVRTRKTATQTKKSYSGRLANVKGAFELKEGADVTGKTIVILDDIITTGATILECAQTLERAGAREVILTCFARTPSENID